MCFAHDFDHIHLCMPEQNFVQTMFIAAGYSDRLECSSVECIGYLSDFRKLDISDW